MNNVLKLTISFNRFCEIILKKFETDNIENVLSELLVFRKLIYKTLYLGTNKKKKPIVTREIRMIMSLINRIENLYDRKIGKEKIINLIKNEQKLEELFRKED